MVAPREHPKPLSKYSFDFLSFLELFCLPWAPFGLHFGSLWLTLGSLLAPFGFLWVPLGLSLAPKHLIASGGEISPRSCRERAENPPRTRREPAV